MKKLIRNTDTDTDRQTGIPGRQTDRQFTWLTRLTSSTRLPAVAEHPGRVALALSDLPPVVALTRVPVPVTQGVTEFLAQHFTKSGNQIETTTPV